MGAQSAMLEGIQAQFMNAVKTMEQRQMEQMSVLLKAFEVQQASQAAHAAEFEKKMKAVQDKLLLDRTGQASEVVMGIAFEEVQRRLAEQNTQLIGSMLSSFDKHMASVLS